MQHYIVLGLQNSSHWNMSLRLLKNKVKID